MASLFPRFALFGRRVTIARFLEIDGDRPAYARPIYRALSETRVFKRTAAKSRKARNFRGRGR